MGNDGDMDNLQFDYTGNQIKWIFDDAGNWNIYNLKEYTERNNSLVNPGVEFFYDDNGNLVTDYDRDIVTIRYNLLNLPDTIQFRNGNQIVHRYDASGRRLSTRYVTIYFQLAQPLNQGEVVSGIDVCYEDNVSIVGNDYVENIEYYTARYFDYDLSEVPVESYLANKIYFDQGYIQGFRLVHSTPRYYYFRHDQLGNIREVWVAAYIRYGQTKPAATVQRLQYYPSGLPWKENDTYSPSGQNRKYNGKEFVESVVYASTAIAAAYFGSKMVKEINQVLDEEQIVKYEKSVQHGEREQKRRNQRSIQENLEITKKHKTMLEKGIPSPQPDGGSNPKRPVGEWKIGAIVAVGIAIGKELHDNIVKPKLPKQEPAKAKNQQNPKIEVKKTKIQNHENCIY